MQRREFVTRFFSAARWRRGRLRRMRSNRSGCGASECLMAASLQTIRKRRRTLRPSCSLFPGPPNPF